MGLSGMAFGDVMMDQIGLDDGSSIDATNATASQDFEAAYDIYDIITMDNFTGAGDAVESVEAVITGWNGYVSIAGISGWTVSLHSSPTAAAADLAGDIATQFVDVADAVISGTWAGVGGDLVMLPVAMTAAIGDNWVSVMPANEFATNGQTAVALSTIGDGEFYQANPGGGFGMPGNMQTGVGNSAYRVSGTSDPCDAPYDGCPEDVDGDGSFTVDDLLAIIGGFGDCGDGTYRPDGDINGSCCVDVDDILQFLGVFGGDCLITGACCIDDGSCSEQSSSDCAAAGGDYNGDNSACSDADCPQPAACCVGTDCSMLLDADCATAGGTGYPGQDCSTVDCSITTGACCMDAQTCLDGMTPGDCTAFGGDFMGLGSDCATTECGTPGDNCEEAITAYDGANAFDTTNATDSGYGEPDDTMCSGTYLNWLASPDQWLVYSPSGSGVLSVSLCDAASYDTSLVVYQGNDCASLTQVACNGDSTVESGCQVYYSGTYDIPVDGSDIYIRLGGYNAAVGAGTCTITFADDSVASCCLPDGSCMDMLSVDCAAAGGSYDGSIMCAEADCPQPYSGCPAGSDYNCDDCAVDGDDGTLDCNGGLNAGVPAWQDITLDVPMCGTTTVFVDGPTGGTYRDLDWFTNAAVNAGGNFSMTAGTSGADLLFGILDNVSGAFVEAYVMPGGYEGTVTLAAFGAGDYSVIAGASEWNTAWTCGSGLENYVITISAEAATLGACCMEDLSCMDMYAADCAAAGGTFDGSQDCSTAVCEAAAAGDECTEAIAVSDGATAFDTSVMTPSQPQPDEAACTGPFAMDWNNTNDGWYMYVATGGLTTFDTCDGSSFDTSMVLYEDACDNQVACNGDIDVDPAGCQAYSSFIEYNCVAGATYYIRLGEWNGGPGGAGTLNIN